MAARASSPALLDPENKNPRKRANAPGVMTDTGDSRMPVLTVYRHGISAGVPPMKNDHLRAKRGEVGGWSEGASRRNVRFLYGIEERQLEDAGYAVTLTVRDCPPSATKWHAMRRAWVMRMARAGMTRLHWVTEWQRRGVPHLHGAIFFPANMARSSVESLIVAAWLDVSREFGTAQRGQFVHPITGVVGWFQYLAKHAARGVAHYQRSSANIPPGWKSKTGRMWGHAGDWPQRPSVRFSLQDQNGDKGYFAYRRLARSWRVADARSRGDTFRLRSARTMLRCEDRALSHVRGISEWIPEAVSMGMLANLAERGYAVRC